MIAESETCQTDEPPQSAASDASPDVDLDFETELLTSTELENAQSCLPLLKAVLELTKSLVQLLLAEGALHDGSTVESWESLLFHVKGLADVANDLGAALFAPQELSEVASAADSLNTGCQLVVDELPDDLSDAQRKGMQDLCEMLSARPSSCGVRGVVLAERLALYRRLIIPRQSGVMSRHLRAAVTTA